MRTLKVQALYPGHLSPMPVFDLWQETKHKCVDEVIDAPIALAVEVMGLQYMMISKIGLIQLSCRKDETHTPQSAC